MDRICLFNSAFFENDAWRSEDKKGKPDKGRELFPISSAFARLGSDDVSSKASTALSDHAKRSVLDNDSTGCGCSGVKVGEELGGGGGDEENGGGEAARGSVGGDGIAAICERRVPGWRRKNSSDGRR